MTLFEAIKANPVFANISDNLVESVLIGRGFDGSTDYTGSTEQVRMLELVTADLYVMISNQPSWKEGQLSVTYNNSALLNRALYLYGKYNDDAGNGLGDRRINLPITDASDYA